MQCPSCGTWFADTHTFCSSCGDILSEDGSLGNIGPYRLLEVIGQGGMGKVYRGENTESGESVAIKVLHPKPGTDPSHVARFKREARIHAGIQHPNVTRLIDVIEQNELLALVMELMQGCTLKDYIAFRGIPETGEIVTLSTAILNGLQAAHAQNIVHRDMKLSNVFLCNNGEIKIMDFGLAKNPQEISDITNVGSTIGSYYYISPEQIQGGEIDIRSDLYAFGVMLYRMATGQLPFSSTGGGEFELMEKQVRQQPPAPESINPDIPTGLRLLIMQLLEKDPGHRPGSCEEVLALLPSLASPLPVQLPKQGGLQEFSGLSTVSTVSTIHQPAPTATTTRSDTDAEQEEHEPPRHSLLWAFRHHSPEISMDVPVPLDLSSPPPIHAEVLQALRTAIIDIPPLPEIWQRIQQMLSSQDASPSDLAKEIEMDPVLTAHVLKICNSAAFRIPGSKPITSIALALTRMGLEAAQDIILQFSVPTFGELERSDPEVRSIWFHGRTIAAINRMLSDYSRLVDQESASLFGMLHDIGKLVILHKENESTLNRMRERIHAGEAILKVEWEILGYTHIDAGMMLALHWQLPRTIHNFIYYHHHPCWHKVDAWPAKVQPAIMLTHMAHIVMNDILTQDEPSSYRGIWQGEARSHLPETEKMLYRPLKIPATDQLLYTRIQQEVQRIRSTFPDLYAQAEN